MRTVITAGLGVLAALGLVVVGARPAGAAVGLYGTPAATLAARAGCQHITTAQAPHAAQVRAGLAYTQVRCVMFGRETWLASFPNALMEGALLDLIVPGEVGLNFYRAKGAGWAANAYGDLATSSRVASAFARALGGTTLHYIG